MKFQAFLKKTIPITEAQVTQFKKMAAIKTRQDKGHLAVFNGLARFEEVGVDYYSENNESARILKHESRAELWERLKESENKWKNSF